MSLLTPEQVREIDQKYLWHPYQPMHGAIPPYVVESAQGVYLQLGDGRRVIDGMASWWCMIHGYSHSRLNQALHDQIEKMAHVMFGGLTHEPAAGLAEKLVELTPRALQSVFLCDSGSVAVEVAIKMALQYWIALGKIGKSRLVTLRNGYHGDTFAAMAVCDPVNGMHHLFKDVLPQHFFVEAPTCRDDVDWESSQIEPLRQTLESHHREIAALILEPIVQGAGGMRFYCPEYLRQARALCDEYDVLMIADEIATGFGRTGRLFAVEHAGIAPDIMCLGKSLTGGYMTLAATLTTRRVSEAISNNPPGALMHGPTFMANPLACSVAGASIELLLSGDWQQRVAEIEGQLRDGLMGYADHPAVADVRVLGAIGVVELKEPLDMAATQEILLEQGVWLRPFGRLLYTMPPFITEAPEVAAICSAIGVVLDSID
ncbi:MAG: adenosylmethionine--8-amino-7-oxononanoate transaminase [Candidatus Sedimenticola sp. (ex Thyasira tokunagai)]